MIHYGDFSFGINNTYTKKEIKMKKLKCYYAHTMTSYGSTIEEQDLELLKKLGFEIINPNTDKISKGVDKYIDFHGANKVMGYFEKIVAECDVIAFRSIPGGRLLSGVSAEVQIALELHMPIIELPCSLQTRMMDYPETKQYLIELGHYKK